MHADLLGDIQTKPAPDNCKQTPKVTPPPDTTISGLQQLKEKEKAKQIITITTKQRNSKTNRNNACNKRTKLNDQLKKKIIHITKRTPKTQTFAVEQKTNQKLNPTKVKQNET